MNYTRREILPALAAAAGSAATAQQASPFTKGICAGALPPGMTLEQRIEAARKAGFDAIEIATGRDVELDVSASDLARIAAVAEKNRIVFASVWATAAFGKTPLNHPDAKIRAQGIAGLKRTIEIAKALNCGAILMVPGRVDPSGPLQAGYETTWQRISAELPRALPAAEAAKVVLTMENVWNKFLLSPPEMRSFVDQFRSPWLAAHFDVGNVMQFGFPQDWIRTLGSRIRRVHVKDFNTARGESGRFVKLPEGDVSWKEVMGSLRSIQYRGSISVETPHDPDDPDLLKLSRSLDQVLTM